MMRLFSVRILAYLLLLTALACEEKADIKQPQKAVQAKTLTKEANRKIVKQKNRFDETPKNLSMELLANIQRQKIIYVVLLSATNDCEVDRNNLQVELFQEIGEFGKDGLDFNEVDIVGDGANMVVCNSSEAYLDANHDTVMRNDSFTILTPGLYTFVATFNDLRKEFSFWVPPKIPGTHFTPLIFDYKVSEENLFRKLLSIPPEMMTRDVPELVYR